MNLQTLIKTLTDLLARKTTGVVTIILHEGGIRKVRLEKEIK